MSASRISDLLPEQTLPDGTTHQGFHPFQWEAVDVLAANDRHVVADQPGLGKTLELLAGLERRGLLERRGALSLLLTVGIVAQTDVMRMIEAYVRPAYPDLRVLYLHSGSNAKKEQLIAAALDVDLSVAAPLLIVANHNAIDYDRRRRRIAVPTLLMPWYDAIIIDESQLVLPTKENSGSADLTKFWHGLEAIREHAHQVRWAASGTPLRGKLENALGLWRFLWPADPQFRWYWPWVKRNFRLYEKVVNRHGRKVTAIEQKPLDPLGWGAFQKQHVLRRTKLEVLPQLPAKQYVNVEFDLTPAMTKQYRTYEDDLRAEAEQRASIGLIESADYLAMKMYTRGRQLATCAWRFWYEGRSEKSVPEITGTEPKIAWALDMAGTRAEAGQSVVVASAFTELLHALVPVFAGAGLEAAVLDGNTSNGERVRIVERFQAGELPVVLLSESLGVGITLDRADDLVMLDVPKDPDMVEQVEDRVHRAGSFHQVTIWRLVSKGTKDVAVLASQDATYRKLRGLSDGSRGVDVRRRVKKEKVSHGQPA